MLGDGHEAPLHIGIRCEACKLQVFDRSIPIFPRSLSCVPANVYWYAALVGYTLSAGKLDALTAADNSNPLFLIVVSAILGAVLGYLMGQLAGVLKTRSAARSGT